VVVSTTSVGGSAKGGDGSRADGLESLVELGEALGRRPADERREASVRDRRRRAAHQLDLAGEEVSTSAVLEVGRVGPVARDARRVARRAGPGAIESS
jgi:hypothetical protein